MPPKRKTAATTSTASAPAAKKTGRPPKTGRAPKPASPPTPSIPWPQHFRDLELVHRALNLVQAFFCSRKQLTTTFDNLRSAVEAHTRRTLTITDIAQIKCLVPKGVYFEYVDDEALQIYVAGGGREKERDEAYSKTRQGGVEEDGHGHGEEVLLFEFVEDVRLSIGGKLKSLKKGKTAAGMGEFKMPTVSVLQMKKLIDKRNSRFQVAVDQFVQQCVEAGEDPVESIQKQHRPYIPEKSNQPSPASLNTTTIPVEIPTERKSIAEIIEEIKREEVYSDQIVEDGHRMFDEQPPVYGDLSFLMSQELVNAIYTARNITRLYSHQVEAINNLNDGHHVIVSTSTSSGKSLIYQIPVLHELEQDRDSRAMFIFPTKALAQDQKRSLTEVLSYMPRLGDVVVDTFDGDTPSDERRRIRDEASVIFTNPDMLHLNILPNEEHWRMFLKNLKFVVVDELHVYTGLFGSHVAFIMRRLRRICSAVGNHDVRFISCSATISNPIEHMRNIFGIDSVRLTDVDGSPSGRKEFLCWNTPFKAADDPSSGRADSISEAARIFAQLILRGVRTIAFCRIRTACELVLRAVRAELQRLGRGEVTDRVMGYRGGYIPQDRRRIEKEMFEGQIMGIVATNALELGVDIGSLDAVITVNFPHSISAFRQQSGRAGRRNRDSLSVLVGGAFPIDQHYMTHPSELFTKSSAPLTVDITNASILEAHLQCAAHELPVDTDRDSYFLGPNLPLEKLIFDATTGFHNPHPRYLPYPPRHVAIRDTEDTGYAVIDVTHSRNVLLEELEPSRAIFALYEGGIFLHQGRPFLIRTFSAESRLAAVEAVNVSWTTSPRDFTDVDPLQTRAIKPLRPPSSSHIAYGPVHIATKVFGYYKLDRYRRILDAVDVDSPGIKREALGVWIDLPSELLQEMRSWRLNSAAGIHAAAHAVLNLLPGKELRTECKAPEKEWAKTQSTRRRKARLVFYEARAGGGGAAAAYGQAEDVLRRACERVENCLCEKGCVDCCLGPACKEGNAVASKIGAAVVLRAALGMKVEEGWMKDVPEEGELGWDSGSVVPVVGAGVGREVRRAVKTEEEDEGDGGVSRFANTIVS